MKPQTQLVSDMTPIPYKRILVLKNVEFSDSGDHLLSSLVGTLDISFLSSITKYPVKSSYSPAEYSTEDYEDFKIFSSIEEYELFMKVSYDLESKLDIQSFTENFKLSNTCNTLLNTKIHVVKNNLVKILRSVSNLETLEITATELLKYINICNKLLLVICYAEKDNYNNSTIVIFKDTF